MNLEADACIDDTYIYNMLLDPDAFVNDAHVWCIHLRSSAIGPDACVYDAAEMLSPTNSVILGVGYVIVHHYDIVWRRHVTLIQRGDHLEHPHAAIIHRNL